MLLSVRQRSLSALVWIRILITPGSLGRLFAPALVVALVSLTKLIISIGLVIVVDPLILGCRLRAVGVAELLTLGAISN